MSEMRWIISDTSMILIWALYRAVMRVVFGGRSSLKVCTVCTSYSRFLGSRVLTGLGAEAESSIENVRFDEGLVLVLSSTSSLSTTDPTLHHTPTKSPDPQHPPKKTTP